MTFYHHIISYLNGIDGDWPLPEGIELIYPFDSRAAYDLTDKFYKKYYSDKRHRHFLFGINPGRFGAGLTGIPFTDPILLESHCNIYNDIDKKHELSSIFIYEMIGQLGGPEAFYRDYYISSLCPLGFIKNGKNYNYYDDTSLLESVKGYIVKYIELQISQFCKKDMAFSIGRGKNFKIFRELNSIHGWFEKIIPLPHPRWVMQYKRKYKDNYLNEYMLKLGMG